MALSWKDAAYATTAGAGLGLLTGALGGKNTATQVPLETPEQAAARAKLMSFANTGKFGNFTAGEELPLNYGDYGITGLEQQGQTALQGLLRGGIPDQYRMGDTALQSFLTTNPADIQAQFDPFKSQVQRQTKESDRALKRNAGFAGNLYSTGTIRGLGDIQARGNETLTSQLASLADQAAQRRLSAIPLAYQSAESQQNSRLQQISASQQYGALTRQLNDASLKARDAEILRRREEMKMPIQAATSVAGMNTQFGVPSVSTSPYAELLGMVGQIGGAAIGGAYGGPAGAAVGSSVGKTLMGANNTGQVTGSRLNLDRQY